MLMLPRPQYRQSVYVVSNTYPGRSVYANNKRNTFQQFILFLLIMMGSAIFVSSGMLHIRKRAFEKKLEELAARRIRRRPGGAMTFSLSRRRGSNAGTRTDAIASGAVRGTAIKENHEEEDPETVKLEDQNNETASDCRSIVQAPPPMDTALTSTMGTSEFVADREGNGEQANDPFNVNDRPYDHIRFGGDTLEARAPTTLERVSTDQLRPFKRTHSRLFDGSGVGVRDLAQHPRNARPVLQLSEASTIRESSIHKELDLKRDRGSLSGMDKYLKTIDGYIGRNSQFHNLTDKERRKLGGIEYDAICLLSYIVPIYFLLWQLLGALGVGAWFQINAPDVTLQNGRYFKISDMNC